MLTTAHYFTRRGSPERRLAREALTEAARVRHANLVAHFASLSERAQEALPAQRALAVGQD